MEWISPVVTFWMRKVVHPPCLSQIAKWFLNASTSSSFTSSRWGINSTQFAFESDLCSAYKYHRSNSFRKIVHTWIELNRGVSRIRTIGTDISLKFLAFSLVTIKKFPFWLVTSYSTPCSRGANSFHSLVGSFALINQTSVVIWEPAEQNMNLSSRDLLNRR